MFIQRMMNIFNHEMSEDLFYSYDPLRSTYGREALNIYQIWNGESFETPGIRTVILNETGMLNTLWFENWIFIDEVIEPRISFEEMRDGLMEDIESVNNTFKVHIRSVIGYSSYGWMEKVQYSADEDELYLVGYTIIFGRICCVIELDFNVTGNFTHRFREKYVVADDEQFFRLGWFLDVETGILLCWSTNMDFGMTGKLFYGNLIGYHYNWID
jgi:hypothetical protein